MTKRIAVPIIAALALVFAASVALIARAQPTPTGSQYPWLIPTGMTHSTQQFAEYSQGVELRLTNNTATTALTISPLAGTSEQATVRWVCRAISGTGVTAGDTWSSTVITAFKNPSGTASFTSSGSTTLSTLSDTSMSGVQGGFAASGGNINVQVAGLSGVTMDCMVTDDVIAD
jgi:hypothetical protein